MRFGVIDYPGTVLIEIAETLYAQSRTLPTNRESLSGRRLGSSMSGRWSAAAAWARSIARRDTKLDRDVAIKVLCPRSPAIAERLARFNREAQVLASLNHPNIAHIHGLEAGESGPFLVMELVEGPTLADRIAQGPIPLDEAIADRAADRRRARGGARARHHPSRSEARQHQGRRRRRGEGARLRPGQGAGQVRIGDRRSAERANSPTITTPAMTQAGMILGTAAYMSPEQAKGRVVDKRSDIWAFGCVLFEMLTGKRAFDGEDVTDTIAAVGARRAGLDGAAGGYSAADAIAAAAMPGEGSPGAHLGHRRGAIPDERDDPAPPAAALAAPRSRRASAVAAAVGSADRRRRGRR